MTGRAAVIIIAPALAVVLCCVGGLAALTGVARACTTMTTPSSGVGRYDAEQTGNAGLIVAIGVRNGVPVRGQVIAVATALQESNLRNLGDLGAANDHDSLGLFQQRPSQGWGTPAQLLDPQYAAAAFYRKLLTIPAWPTMPLTVAAQAVQRSAYPGAYAKWEADATLLVGSTAGQASGGGSPGAGCAAAGGWTRPVDGPVVSGFRTAARSGHDGVDIAAARGTPIRAAAAGLVIRMVCNAHRADGTPYSCDVDGDPETVLGCGWYVEVAHADTTVTRYCHMVRRPSVTVGELVAAGQVIGDVGSSGHSSGPHLHLETHTGQPATRSNAVDPIDFFAVRDLDLTATER